jgi:serine/threonine protein kinase
LTPERWAQIEELFHRSAECQSEQRNALLDEACSNDPELRREVELLLSCDAGAGGFVQSAIRSELNAVEFPLTGKVISHYRILDGVGGGGMGLVYRAEDIRLGRLVALKFLPEDSAKDPAALRRFEREARAASALEHPNVCSIYEFGEHEGQPFLVMQLLEGQTLRELISAARDGGLPLELRQLLGLGIQILDGLEAAHRQGIIHRDIKPANIFVTTQGEAKILDFGLATLATNAPTSGDEFEQEPGDAPDVDRSTLESKASGSDLFLSRAGVAMGTAGYMSPEQVCGEKLDARTDLFSLGLVLYEMATEKRAFAGDTGPALREAILNQMSRPAREVNPELPVKLEQVINKALEKDREARYQSAAEMRADLEITKRQMETRHLSRPRVLALGVVLLLIVGAIVWFAKRQQASHNRPNLNLHQLTVNSSDNPVTGGAISPDGKYLAYTDAKGIHIKVVGTDDIQSVPQPDALKNGRVNWEILSPSWFPDSNRFVVNAHPPNERPSVWSSRTSSIWIVSALGGSPRKLRDNALAWSVSPDGSSISFGANEGRLGPRELWLMEPGGEHSRKLYEAGEESAICCLYFFPNGKRVSYVTTDDSGDTLVARTLNGGPVTTLLRASEMKNTGDLLWLADGRLIYSDLCNGEISAYNTPCNYWSERLNTYTGEVVEKPRRLTDWTGFWLGNTSASADGRRVAFVRSTSRGISYVADLEVEGTRLTNSRRFTLEEGGDDVILDWTADSKTVIVGLNRGDHYSLRKQSLNSDAQEPIVSSAEGLLEDATVSPDGKWVIIAAWRSIPGSLAEEPLMRVPITGGLPELILQRSRTGFGLAFCTKPPFNLCAFAERTDDRKQMVVTSFDVVKGRGPELARFDIDPDLNLSVDNLLWTISPDGNRLAVARGPEGPIEIRPLLGGPTQVIGENGLKRMRGIGWSSDGKSLLVSNLTNEGSEVAHVDLHGKTKVLWTCKSDKCFGMPSPDGRHLAIYEQKLSANIWMMENF